MTISTNNTIISASPEETEIFASKFAEKLPFGSIVAIHGDLGAGKTVFARGFARGLGIQEKITSPTFTIIQEYPLQNNLYFYHLDLYRIDGAHAALAFGVDEYLLDPNAIALVEWAERAESLLPKHTKHIHINHLGPETREIQVSGLDHICVKA